MIKTRELKSLRNWRFQIIRINKVIFSSLPRESVDVDKLAPKPTFLTVLNYNKTPTNSSKPNLLLKPHSILKINQKTSKTKQSLFDESKEGNSKSNKMRMTARVDNK